MHGICQAQRKFNCNRHLICAWMGNNQLVVFGKKLRYFLLIHKHARYVQIFRMQANRTVDNLLPNDNRCTSDASFVACVRQIPLNCIMFGNKLRK
jgi:hypothetical protein